MRGSGITDIGEVYALLKDEFKDIIQELLVAELESSLGYSKNKAQASGLENKRNGYSKKQ